MSAFEIEGGIPLSGTVVASGNKNAALPMIAAALLTDEPVILRNVPQIRDVASMLDILDHLGVDIQADPVAGTLRLCAANLRADELPRHLCDRLRTSFLLVAPLLLRRGRAKVYPPGGDVIGHRRLDAHVYGLRKLGATVSDDELSFAAPRPFVGADLFFDEASVTATEHLLMAAARAKGTTTIRNAASEPHVQDLCRLLRAMGATIDGIGTNTLTIEGTERLHGADFRISSDHIEVGSFLALAAATRGQITVRDTVRSHYWMINRVFERFNLRLEFGPDSVTLPGGQEPRLQKDLGGVIPRVDDGPWPQFPSDLMSSMLLLATQSDGIVLFFEKMFESRLYFVDYLMQMGASIVVCDPHRVVINGPTRLHGQPVRSPDIRAGIALVSAALCAKGPSRVDNAEIVDRGYERLETKLQALGARIRRVP